ncbi:UDP-N-acetylmuramate:L-alanyl-gamma-D-glutamyl-meso-diaminopimelate ligase [Desulfobotulus sp. H1]|uniref:UDP-N-acetylmuramate:L-alanyl-gamma-D-glutamyl-meso-diaminopimelate ligase n=1 Tax=Desulfobotulus pelophilus TaxID=2823377 RepID=A0ABT3NCN4_9BACT|nr:UDP-N-acetylmuramate:L-alanyl-gamma-D-glutamyl-meso-diaminopimelate ligase [Desulfobotulus pelophilus]MCW7755212.1 UDP-N-acetylmuramate:L-alanyl-gamma-D-glutamyl-meso-diaminopimelate ligase [Desulfobotulus pelophilus]
MLDPENNRIPEGIRHIHLIAICGTAMGALAALLQDAGFRVTGSDQNVYPPMSTFLLKKGIGLTEGFDAAMVLEEKPDLVVVGNAVRRDNPEALALAESGIPYCSLPQALNHFLVGSRKAIVVAGTHGKTTTTALMAWVLEKAGLAPGFMIGGIACNFEANYRMGKGPYVVLEGDEYDTAFFDKRSKFLHFHPYRAILTGVEFDHADIFSDLEQVEKAFEGFVRKLLPEGLLVANRDFTAVKQVLERCIPLEKQCTYFGRTSADKGWFVADVSIHSPTESFTVLLDGNMFCRVETSLPGEHNRMNILAVCAVAHSLGLSPGEIASGIGSFTGVKRRQEKVGVSGGITIMDDFAHHPTAVSETIRAVRPHVSGRLIAVFEPRTNTSMRRVFQKAYAGSFDMADLVCVREIPLPDKVAAESRFSSSELVRDLNNRHVRAGFFQDAGAIVSFLEKEAKAGDLVLVMSNGGFEGIHGRLLAAFSHAEDKNI